MTTQIYRNAPLTETLGPLVGLSSFRVAVDLNTIINRPSLSLAHNLQYSPTRQVISTKQITRKKTVVQFQRFVMLRQYSH